MNKVTIKEYKNEPIYTRKKIGITEDGDYIYTYYKDNKEIKEEEFPEDYFTTIYDTEYTKKIARRLFLR